MFSHQALIHSADDIRIANAAARLYPPLTDNDDLVGSHLKFAVNAATYRVASDGSGTNVFLFGTSFEGHSVCVKAQNFRPYVCVSLEQLDKTIADARVRDQIVEQLVEELQVRLTAAIAMDDRLWSPERQAMRTALAGSLQHNPGRHRCRLLAANKMCRPIVAHDIIQGMSMKGVGPASGYRGKQGQRYLRLYTYSPPLVPWIRDLLRGKHADLGVVAQVSRLSKGRRQTKSAEELAEDLKKDAADKRMATTTGIGGRINTRLTREADVKKYRQISGWAASAYVLQNNDDCGDDENDDSDDSEDGVLEVDGQDPTDEDFQHMLDEEKDELVAQITADEILEEANYDVGDNDHSLVIAGAIDKRRRDMIEREKDKVARTITNDNQQPREYDAAIDDDASEEDSGNEPERRDRMFTQWFSDTEENIEALKNRLEVRFIRRALRAALTSIPAQQLLLSGQVPYDVYEGDMDFTLRMMIDSQFKPEQWISISYLDELTTMPDGRAMPEGAPLRVGRALGRLRETRQQIELHCDYRFLKCDADDPIQMTLPKHCTLSLDCEMQPGVNMEFPVPEKDLMLQCVAIIKDDVRTEAERKTLPKGKFYYRSVSFTLDTVECLSAPRQYCTERHILSFPDEKSLYLGLARFIELVNPQIVHGYNSDSFDLPYLLASARRFGAGKEFESCWGKTVYNSRMTVRERIFQSAAAGMIVYKDIQAPGMETMDLFLKLKKDPQFKERDYSLNAVAAKYANEQKDDVAYSRIRSLQQSESGREILRVYCEKDALLPLEIMENLRMMPGLYEQARICGVPIGALVKRGMQIRAKRVLFAKGLVMKPLRCMFYTRTDEERELAKDDSYKGATVIDPKNGLYEKPVDTLDFEALYPSIMRKWNVCFSTRVDPGYDLTLDPDIMQCADPVNQLTREERDRRAQAATYIIEEYYDVTEDKVAMRCDDPVNKLSIEERKARAAVYIRDVLHGEEPPYEKPFVKENGTNIRFLRHEYLVGLIPLILDEYASLRKKAKKDQRTAKDAGDTSAANIHDLRQSLFKLMANSMYGYVGSTTASQYCEDAAATVTMRGRVLLQVAAALVMKNFTPRLREAAEKKAGRALPADAVCCDIIYGDTDSIFVHLPFCDTLEEAARWGVEMADHVTAYLRQRYLSPDDRWNVLVLAFEKTFRRLLLLAKKKYAGLLYKFLGADNSLRPDPGDCIPSLSGLDGKRRDTTLLISEHFIDLVALLLDYHYDTQTNINRLRKFMWQYMVRPLLTNTINLRQLSCTKQVRKTIDQYTTNKAGHKQTPPIHVQLFAKQVARAGGPDSAGAPRSGDRLSYVVIRSELKQKVSSRGENPIYVLDNNLPIDALYYLDKHIKPSVLRLVVPVLSKGKIRYGRTEAAKIREEKKKASERLFGHATDYIDRNIDEELGEVVPATMAARIRADEENKTTRVSQRMLIAYDVRTGEKLRRERYYDSKLVAQYREIIQHKQPPATSAANTKTTNSVSAAAAATKKRWIQPTLLHHAANAVACASCDDFYAGQSIGYVCDECLKEKPSAKKMVVDTLCKLLVDIEDLNRERTSLVDRCNDCVGCRDAPKKITCENSSCPTFWDRKLNLRSLDELQKRMLMQTQSARFAGAMPAIDLRATYADDDDGDDDEEAQQRKRKKSKKIKTLVS